MLTVSFYFTLQCEQCIVAMCNHSNINYSEPTGINLLWINQIMCSIILPITIIIIIVSLAIMLLTFQLEVFIRRIFFFNSMKSTLQIRRILSNLLLFYLIFGELFPFSVCSVKFDLEELTHDCPTVDKEKQIVLQVSQGQQLKYKLRSPQANLTIHLFLTKPYQVREAEFHGNYENHMIIVNESSSPYIHFVNANAKHRGHYNLYRFEYDSNNVLVNYSRTDFYLVVEGKWQLIKSII